MRMYLGIEIGGTKLQLGLGPGDGTLKALWRGAVEPAQGADGIRRQITAALPELLTKAGLSLNEVRAAGIGFGGPVDDATHTVIKSHQIEGWDDFPLQDWISDVVGLPAILGNDADCAGLGEALFGAGKGLSPIFYITIGSGIGGGLIINGEIYRGCGRGAAEIGHLRVREESATIHPPELVGVHPIIVEEGASGWAIANIVRRSARAIRDPLPSLVQLAKNYGPSLTAQHVAQAAAQGDEAAQAVLTGAISFLTDGICNVIALLGPRRIVIGGGVSLMGEQLLFEPLRRLVAERVFKPFANCYDIVPAALGEEVVIHGALALARRHFGDAAP
jgi:glucokinase